jgi:hypothetical protein
MTTPLKAIRAHCLHCSAGKPGEVRRCPCTWCNLHPFRFGKLPRKAGQELTQEERLARVARLNGGSSAVPEKQGETGLGSDIWEGGAA